MDQIGKYIVLEEIGQGGMGIVYKARDPMIGREVAVKVIPERIMQSPDLKERFLREIASAGRLSHENIMTIYDAGEYQERPYFVMELLSGTDLSSVIREESLSLDKKLGVALQVASGLRYAHERGVIHRDIKPDNVRVLTNGKAKIMDFGIARVESATRTPTHSSIGTPRYMSPEQIKGENIDRRTDIFSFGALFYELLAGDPPFSGERVTTVIYKILHEDPAPLELGDVPGADALRRLVDKTLAKEADKRYSTFEEVIADLDAVVAERNAVTPTVTHVAPSVVERAEAESQPEPEPEPESDETIAVSLPPQHLDPLPPPDYDPETLPVAETLASQDVEPPLSIDSEATVVEPLPEALRSPTRPAEPPARAPSSRSPEHASESGTDAAAPSPAKPSGGVPVRALGIGAVVLMALLGLAYGLTRSGDEPVPEPSGEELAVNDPTPTPLVEPDSVATLVEGPGPAPIGTEPENPEPASSSTPTPAGDEPRAAVDDAPRVAAEAQRTRMRSAKSRADRADAAAAASGLYDRAAAQERAGDTAFRRGSASSFGEAETAFAEATRLYDRARRDAARRAEAEAAQQATEQARAAVLGKRSDTRIAADFQRAETQRATAERQLRSGDYGDAVTTFGAARAIYVAAAQTASQPLPRDPEPEPEPEPTPPEPSPEEQLRARATSAIDGLARRLKQALESEDPKAMREVHVFYDNWDGFFRIAENVRATVSVGSITMNGNRATANVDLSFSFRNTSKNANESQGAKYRWTLERRGDGWAFEVVTR